MDTAEFSLRLQERLHSLDFWALGLTQEDLDGISEGFGTPRKTPEDMKEGIEELDIPLIDAIAYYLVVEEELSPTDEEHELEFMLRTGNFIYGWEKWKLTQDDLQPRG